MKKYRKEILNVFASCPHMLADVPYHSVLPSDIAGWHCYVADCGHNILSLPRCFIDEAFATNVIENFLVPISVKTVLRGYQIRDGYVVVDVEYDPLFGVRSPDGDDEY